MAQVFWTVFSGVVIYVLGQIILKWFIDPAQDARRAISQIGFVLVQQSQTAKHILRINEESYRLNCRAFLPDYFLPNVLYHGIP